MSGTPSPGTGSYAVRGPGYHARQGWFGWTDTVVGLSEAICNHTFRATGITAFRANAGTLEQAQEIANHASPKTTKLYDRSSDQITLDMVERIVI